MPGPGPQPVADSPILLRASDRAPQLWRNGGGVTFEVARRAAPPQSQREFLWRVSIARVESPGPFSAFAGFERLIAVIDGPGMRLEGLSAWDVELRPFVPFRFDGAARVTGSLPDGPVSDLNVIFDPRYCAAWLSVAESVPAERRAGHADLLIFNLAPAPMECVVDGATLALHHRDALWISGPDAIVSCRGVTRAAIVEIDEVLGVS